MGIIAEYNPFHNGHKYHLMRALEETGADCCVALMSGNFLQRGEPALWDKRLRAQMAVDNGINLVIELPFVFACNNAEEFAYGGVSLLSGLGCITDLAFGCEGDADILQRTATYLALEGEEWKGYLMQGLDQGMSYPAARTEALRRCGEVEGAKLLTQPNNILATEYLRQCLLTGSPMHPVPIRRLGNGYHDKELSHSLSSATAIREEWAKSRSLQQIQPFLPKETTAVLKEVNRMDHVFLNDFYQMIAYKIRSSTAAELGAIWAATEGLENSLKKAVVTATDMDTLICGIKSKRYTITRIQRLLLQTMMGLSGEDYSQIRKEKLNYAHVLAFDERGAGLLRHIKKTKCSRIPVYSNLSKEVKASDPEQLLLNYDLLASDLYHIIQKKDIYQASDLVLAPYRKNH